ncbi:MAG TPA: ATP-binding protein [Ktedonobacteraceae bacterium]|jgi:two-component system sensor histidine kinase KdpD
MMYHFKHLLAPVLKWRILWRRTLWDTLLALIGACAMTMILYGLHLYPRIPNISLVYLLVVLVLASTRGLYPAILSSVVAFLSFDFFLVQPFYTFTIAQPEEWLALFTFLCTAMITGQMAAALRQRAELARAREGETRILYELVRDTNNAEDLDHQLGVVVRTVVDVFASRGVRDCLLLLPDKENRPLLRASAQRPLAQCDLTADEFSTAAWVMRAGQTVELYDGAHLPRKRGPTASRVVIRSTRMPQSLRRYLCLFPLKTGQRVVGVLGMVIEEDPRRFSRNRRLGSEADRSDPASAFFWAFLDQTVSMIERARLRQESFQLEILQRTDALRAALLSSVSHDLRTPLTSIKAAASSLLQEDVRWNEEERRSFTQTIEHEADRLNRLVENLLDLSRIEGGALTLEKEWYPIDELLHDVLGRMEPLLQGRDVRLDLPTDLPPVELDYLMIDQVLTNLLENAQRYTPPDSPIEITVLAGATELILSVADHGSGIPQGDLERIFDKFYRVMGPASKRGGTGVGLSVCRGLVEAHGGRIWAENRRCGGAVFHLTLPLRRPGYSLPNSEVEESRA